MLKEVSQNSFDREFKKENSRSHSWILSHPLLANVRTERGPDGETWYVAVDIAKAIEYRQSAEAVKLHCKRFHRKTIPLIDYPLNTKSIYIIPESDVFRLIMQTQVSGAAKLQDWIISKVRPSGQKRHSKRAVFGHEDIPVVHHVATGILSAPIFASVRSIFRDDGKQWFVAADICSVLELGMASATVRIHCKKSKKIIIERPGLALGKLSLIIIPEAEVYRLAMKSKSTKAATLQNWLTTEVFPASLQGRRFKPFKETIEGCPKTSDTSNREDFQDNNASPLGRTTEHPAPSVEAQTDTTPEKTETQAQRTGAEFDVTENPGAPRADTPTETGAIAPFENPEFGRVRVRVDDAGDPWFVAKDICRVLEIEKYRDAVSRLEEDERGSVLMDTLGGKQEIATVSESGMYSLIFRSRKPEARRFRKWVTADILPAIRKRGTYVTSAKVEEFHRSLENLIRLASEWEKDRQSRFEAQDIAWNHCSAKIDATTERIAQLEERVLLLQAQKNTAGILGGPKTESEADVEIAADDTGNISVPVDPPALPRKMRGRRNDGIAMRDLAGLIRLNANCCIGTNSLYQYLRDNGYLNDSKKRWNKPTEHSLAEGLFRESKYRHNLYIVTQKGQSFFSGLFQQNEKRNNKDQS
jgi:prophage antirepressor-like protein